MQYVRDEYTEPIPAEDEPNLRRVFQARQRPGGAIEIHCDGSWVRRTGDTGALLALQRVLGTGRMTAVNDSHRVRHELTK